MKRAVILHCDIAGGPYRIENFRRPIEELRVIKEVTGIGAYQKSHVWLVNLLTNAAKQKLLEAGRLLVRARTCIVIDPTRQETRVKLHWVAFDVTSDTIRKPFLEYREVKDLTLNRLKVPGFY